MKRSIILLVSTLLVLGLAGGALWFLMGYEPPQDAASSSAPAMESVTLFEKPTDKALSISVTNASGSFSIKPAGDQYTIDGYEAAHLNQSTLKSCVSPFSFVSGQLVDAQPQDLAQFGLTKPQATVTASYDGGSFTMGIGGQAPGSSAYYASVPGDSAVYLVYSLGGLLQAPMDFVDTTVTTSPDPTGQAQVLPAALTLGGTVRETALVLGTRESSEAEQQMGISGMQLLSHNNREINYDKMGTALSPLFGIIADRVEAYKPDEAKLAQVGLDQPYSTAAFTWLDAEGKEQSCTLLTSAPQDGMVYMLREGMPVLYQVSVDKLPWLELQYQDIVSTLFILPNIKDVSVVTVEAPGVKEVYTISPTADDDITVTNSKGEALDVDNFKKQYQCLIGVRAEEYTTTLPAQDAKTLLTITYTYRNGRTPNQVTLLAGPPLQAYVSVDGTVEFLTKEKYVEIILKNIPLLNAGEKVLPLY